MDIKKSVQFCAAASISSPQVLSSIHTSVLGPAELQTPCAPCPAFELAGGCGPLSKRLGVTSEEILAAMASGLAEMTLAKAAASH
jgi:hypothetical protein